MSPAGGPTGDVCQPSAAPPQHFRPGGRIVSKRRSPPTPREILALVRALPPEEQEGIRQALNAPPGPGPFPRTVWVPLAEAAQYCHKSASQVSRDCSRGKLVTNGKGGRDLRVCLWSVVLASASGIVKQLKRYGRLQDTGEEGKALKLAEELLREVRAYCPGGWDRVDDLEDQLERQLERLAASYWKQQVLDRSLRHPPPQLERQRKREPFEVRQAEWLLIRFGAALERFPLHNR
jgi:hypothetical protein